MCLTSALPKILPEVETFGERCMGGLGGHEGDRMNKEEEVVDKSILTMLIKLF